jgi:hypothetical protein
MLQDFFSAKTIHTSCKFRISNLLENCLLHRLSYEIHSNRVEVFAGRNQDTTTYVINRSHVPKETVERLTKK